MSELKELKEHIRWLEDERRDLAQIENRLDKIDADLTALFDGCNGIVRAVNRQREGLVRFIKLIEVLALNGPAPPWPAPFSPNDIKTTNRPKERAANRKPRKTKLSVVPKDGDDGPGAAS